MVRSGYGRPIDQMGEGDKIKYGQSGCLLRRPSEGRNIAAFEYESTDVRKLPHELQSHRHHLSFHFFRIDVQFLLRDMDMMELLGVLKTPHGNGDTGVDAYIDQEITTREMFPPGSNDAHPLVFA